MRDLLFWLSVAIGIWIGAWSIHEHTPIPQPDVVIEVPERQFLDIELPEMSLTVDVRIRKAAFFEFMLPLIEDENRRVLTQRLKLGWLSEQEEWTEAESEWLKALAKEYRVVLTQQQHAWISELQSRVDAVPVSLVLSQAANESAWGSSRFAREGNNLFGQWCFTSGCGLVPLARPEGATYEVATFDSPRQSVAAYVNNLNTNKAYSVFRQLRLKLRQQQQPLSGELLAKGLQTYSSRGEDYVAELQAMIRVNKLSQYDQ